jgi:hypothetical protein
VEVLVLLFFPFCHDILLIRQLIFYISGGNNLAQGEPVNNSKLLKDFLSNVLVLHQTVPPVLHAQPYTGDTSKQWGIWRHRGPKRSKTTEVFCRSRILINHETSSITGSVVHIK